MWKCPYCGINNEDNERFCPVCGTERPPHEKRTKREKPGGKPPKRKKGAGRAAVIAAAIAAAFIVAGVAAPYIGELYSKLISSGTHTGSTVSGSTETVPPEDAHTPTPTVTSAPTETPTLTVSAETERYITVINGIQAPASDFLIPDSSSIYLTDDDLLFLSAEDLRSAHIDSQTAINEIFARYGYAFTSDTDTAKAIRDRLDGKEWYEEAKQYCPVANGEYNELQQNYMTNIERANIQFIVRWQKENDMYTPTPTVTSAESAVSSGGDSLTSSDYCRNLSTKYGLFDAAIGDQPIDKGEYYECNVSVYEPDTEYEDNGRLLGTTKVRIRKDAKVLWRSNSVVNYLSLDEYAQKMSKETFAELGYVRIWGEASDHSIYYDENGYIKQFCDGAFD